jgi:hypothetical protein
MTTNNQKLSLSELEEEKDDKKVKKPLIKQEVQMKESALLQEAPDVDPETLALIKKFQAEEAAEMERL